MKKEVMYLFGLCANRLCVNLRSKYRVLVMLCTLAHLRVQTHIIHCSTL